MLYMLSVDRVRKIHNLRGNPQNRYYPDEEMEGIFQRFADCMDQSPEPAGARGPAGELQAYLTRRFYLCTPEILSGLGEMYAADQRFRAYFDKIRPGLADYVAEALKAYAASL